MDTLRILNHLSAVLTVHEWEAYKETDDFLWMAASVEGYRGEHMDELIRRGQHRRQEAWKIAVEMAESIVSSEMRDLGVDVPEEQRQQTVVRLAERLLVEQNLTPPTFTTWADCDSCGRVPVPDGTPDTTPNCPWCMI